MKLTTAIKAASKGLDQLDKEVAALDAEVRERGKALTKKRAEYDAHREMLNAMHKLQDTMPEGETIEFNYSEPEGGVISLIRTLAALYSSERRDIGDSLGIDKTAQHGGDMEYIRQIIEAARTQERFDEITRRANAFIAGHKT